MPRAKRPTPADGPATKPRKPAEKSALRVDDLAASDRVTLTLDGREISARRGEPVAASLLAAGIVAVARSPKFHRTRGPSCYRAACDGCLARVDGVPNIMTCRIGARDGMAIESQNTLGSRTVDLLRMTDWFFPEGMNHHELFAGVPGVQPLMQAFARRVAGLGRLPEHVGEKHEARRRKVDVLVIGSGPAGMGAALALANQDRMVEVIDDALVAGGSLTALGPMGAPWESMRRVFDEAVSRGMIRLRLETTAGAIYGRDVLVVGPPVDNGSDAGAEILEPRTLILAPGAHDGVVPFEGNDIPGVMSARAGGWLLESGILPGKHVVVCTLPGGGPFGDAFLHAAEARGLRHESGGMQVTSVQGTPIRAHGVSRLKKVDLSTSANGKMSLAADVLLVDAPRAPAYELCEQVGAKLQHTPAGFVVRTQSGRIAPSVYAIGEVTGTPLDQPTLARAIEELADTVRADSSRQSAAPPPPKP